MNVLWISNVTFPEVTKYLTGQEDFRSSGGWMLAAAEHLSQLSEINLNIACVNQHVDDLVVINGNKITYFVIPYGKGNIKYNPEYEKYWLRINSLIKPDVVHIHGTEFSHGLAYIKACGSSNVVISIQGLKSAISNYYDYGLKWWDIVKNLTLHDFLKGGIFKQKRQFAQSGLLEKEMIRNVHSVIGRTTWDKSCVKSINPAVDYYFCNEILRPEFYLSEKWSYDKCVKHTIFLSQASYPVKGLHQVLKALPIVLQKFPDTKVRVAGYDITRCEGLSGFLHYTSYGKLLKSLISKNDLEGKVFFTGSLNADEMVSEYLNCNVFVCPSSIENSPNSLCEAQILGTPHVSSYVGGVPDLMQANQENLYRYEDVEVLAAKIINVFENKAEQVNCISRVKERHSAELNTKQLYHIYQKCCK